MSSRIKYCLRIEEFISEIRKFWTKNEEWIIEQLLKKDSIYAKDVKVIFFLSF